MSTRECAKVREEEILNACEKIYEKKSFYDVTVKDISAETSFSRPSIYNYFISKEEIFLRLFEREYLLWCEELEKIDSDGCDPETLPEKLARSLEGRELMLKLLSDNVYGNLYDVEENSRLERKISFEKAYGRSVFLLDSILMKTFPKRTDPERAKMRNVALEFLQGIHAYASVSPYQVGLMKLAEVIFEEKSVYQLALDGFEIILG